MEKWIALEIAFLLLDEAIEAFQYANDSGGYIGWLVNETLEVIDGTEEEAERFIYVNLKFSTFREKLLNRHFKDGNFPVVN